jgi:hypothetical protein
MVSQNGYSNEWLALVGRMDQLVQETKMVQPSYFYLEIQRRKERATLNLRWRSRGTAGSSLVFGSPRMQEILVSLPVALQRKYVEWELRKTELNQQAKRLRLLLSDRVSRHRVRQHSLI